MHQIFFNYKIWLWQLKLIFTIFIFAIKIKILKNYQKYFFFCRKIFFYPQDFQMFVLPSPPLFFFLGHCWFYRRSWLMRNSTVYGIIMSLNWILKTPDSLIPGDVKFWSWSMINLVHYIGRETAKPTQW